MIYNIFSILFSLILPGIILINPIKEQKRKFIENKSILFAYLILVIGCLVRALSIDIYPKGLNVDEASASYDAYSILKYGIDRNGNFMPIFLEAWGSGQNALYTYIMIPFIKLFGLNIITTRVPMAIIGCISLIVWYYLLKNIKNDKFALIGLAFLSICPWHIMKCRWGLESNLFPDLFLVSISLIVAFLKDNRIYKFYIAVGILALTGYSYGTSYLFLPIFCIALFVYLFYKKQIKLKQIIISFSIIFIVTLPIMLYVVINTFNLPQINLGFITIPKLPHNRYESETTLFSNNVLANAVVNFKNSAKLLFIQNDGVILNCLPNFGMYYIISIPFFIIGFVMSFYKKTKKKYEDVINIWFISAFLLLFVFKETNINRINILIFPVIYYAIKGIYYCSEINKKYINYIIIAIYLIHFIMFEIFYFKLEQKSYTSVEDVKDVIQYVDNLEVEKVYFEYAFKEPYIYVLYYTQYNTYDFISTVEYFRKDGIFDNVKKFGKYRFYLPEETNEENVCYVVKNDTKLNFENKEFKVTKFKDYLVLEKEYN